MESFRERLNLYLKAGHSALYIISGEGKRAEAEVAKEADGLNREAWAWDMTNGWGIIKPDGGGIQKIGQAASPKATIDAAAGAPAGTVLILKDFHPFLPIPEIYSRIKSVLPAFAGDRKTFVFISGRQVIPPELEKELTIMDFCLPDREHLKSVLDELIETVTKAAKEKGETESMLDEDRVNLVEAALGLTSVEAENTFSLARIKCRAFNKDAVRRVQEEKAMTIRKSGLLEWWPNVEAPKYLGGMDLLKVYLAESRVAFTSEARAFGIDGLKGVLLVGAAGTGKTLASKIIAAMWEWPLFCLDIGRIFGSLVGQSEERMRECTHLMETVAPAIVLIDELDKATAGIGSSGSFDNGIARRIIGHLLTWMQEHTAPIYIVASCNSIQSMPPELVDRFDETFFVDLPAYSERQDIFSIHLEKRNRDPVNFDLYKLAEVSEGYTGRDIERIVKRSLIVALQAKREITTEDMVQQLKQRVPTVKIKGEDIAKMREWASEHGVRRASSLAVVPTKEKKRNLDLGANPLNN